MSIFFLILVIIIGGCYYIQLTQANTNLLRKITGKETNQQPSTCIIVSTDPHGWVFSHRHVEEHLNADYPSLLSFMERFKIRNPSSDVLFLENGDFVDGGGLSDETNQQKFLRGQDLFPILSKSMRFDARGLGNHEMYHTDAISSLLHNSPNNNNNNGKKKLSSEFITSNIVDSTTKEPLGERYKFIPLTKRSMVSQAVVMSFLYDMESLVPGTMIEKVEEIVNEPWFTSTLQQSAMFIVLVHMGFNDKLVKVILDKARSIRGEQFIVLFLAGHTHIRASKQLDSHSFVFEAGKYMDTIGLICVTENEYTVPHFIAQYLNANIETLSRIVGLPENTDKEDFDTPHGSEIRKELISVREKLGLDHVVGHLDEKLVLQLPVSSPHSLWGHFINRVVKETLFKSAPLKCNPVIVSNSGSLRYDIFPGPVTIDDLWGVAPFSEGFIRFECVERESLLAAIRSLDIITSPQDSLLSGLPINFILGLPKYIHSEINEHDSSFDVIASDYDAQVLQRLFDSQQHSNSGNKYNGIEFGSLDGHSVWVEWFEKNK
jgi:2',3'-cyclic-nucleotide 2'-phosphodiesterase (5'-nucleotidase family)